MEEEKFRRIHGLAQNHLSLKHNISYQIERSKANMYMSKISPTINLSDSKKSKTILKNRIKQRNNKETSSTRTNAKSTSKIVRNFNNEKNNWG